MGSPNISSHTVVVPQTRHRASSPRGYTGLVLGVLLLMVCVSYASAAVLHVPHGYATIQGGIAAASAGDTVLVAPGVYFENVTMKPGVHIQGEPGAILDGSQGAGAVVSAASGIERTAVLSGFVVRRGRQAGIFLNQAAPTLRNNVIIEHAGPGIDCAQASPYVLNNAIVANAGGGIVCQYPGTAPVITYNAFWQNQPADVLGCTPGIGNRYEDPGFVNASQGDYRLRPNSPLINAGDPDPTLYDSDRSRSDIGAYGGPPPRPEVRRASGTSSVFEELFGTPEVLRTSLSASGLPGLIHVPTATTVPEGSLDVGYNITRDPKVFPGVNQQKNFTFAFGLLPRLTLGGRGTDARNTDTGTQLAGDISANAQLLLLEDKSWWPGVAVGLQDIAGGATFFRSGYVTLSKSLFGRLRGTVGFGTGPDVLKGPFAGVELALNRFVTLLGEYDADAFNAGVRLFPLPEKWETYGLPRPTVDVLWQEGGHVSWGISVRSTLGEAKYQAQREARADKRYSRQSAGLSAATSLQAVSEQYRQNCSNVGSRMYGSRLIATSQVSRSWWSMRIAVTTVTNWMPLASCWGWLPCGRHQRSRTCVSSSMRSTSRCWRSRPVWRPFWRSSMSRCRLKLLHSSSV